jgi:RimJ/RimL family protein N-acetyltransferase
MKHSVWRTSARSNFVRLRAVNLIETERLRLRRLTTDDAPFIFELLNDPAWLRFIGDKGIRTQEDARNYLRQGPLAMYDRVGFGLYLTELRNSGTPIGLCGPIKRDGLKDVDLGFAFLPAFRSHGYAREAAVAVVDYARATLHLARLLAITSAENQASVRLLEKLGMRFERMIRLFPDKPAVSLFAMTL